MLSDLIFWKSSTVGKRAFVHFMWYILPSRGGKILVLKVLNFQTLYIVYKLEGSPSQNLTRCSAKFRDQLHGKAPDDL